MSEVLGVYIDSENCSAEIIITKIFQESSEWPWTSCLIKLGNNKIVENKIKAYYYFRFVHKVFQQKICLKYC